MKTLKGEEAFTPMYHLELVRDRSIPFRRCNPVGEAAQILHEVLDRSPVEQFLCIHMSSDGKMVGLERIAIGTLEQVTVTPADIFRGAILAGVPRIILGHNHPTGSSTPSQPDINMTESMVRAGYMLGVEVYDHVVVSPDGSHTSIYDYTTKLATEELLSSGLSPLDSPGELLHKLLAPGGLVDKVPGARERISQLMQHGGLPLPKEFKR
jgi:DNA repair protein RadC